MNEQWIEIFTASDPLEAEMIRDLLESGGIEVMSRTYKVGPYPVNIGLLGEIRLYVKESDESVALELISS